MCHPGAGAFVLLLWKTEDSSDGNYPVPWVRCLPQISLNAFMLMHDTQVLDLLHELIEELPPAHQKVVRHRLKHAQGRLLLDGPPFGAGWRLRLKKKKQRQNGKVCPAKTPTGQTRLYNEALSQLRAALARKGVTKFSDLGGILSPDEPSR